MVRISLFGRIYRNYLSNLIADTSSKFDVSLRIQALNFYFSKCSFKQSHL